MKGLTHFLSIFIIQRHILLFSLGIFDNESRDKTLSLLNCTSCKSYISMKQN